MKKIILHSLTLCTLCLMTAQSFGAEKVKPVFDDRKWSLGWSKNENGSVFEEYVLEGEKVESWSELVTVQFYPGIDKKITPQGFEELQKKQLTTTCPSIVWTSLSQSEEERLWKWTVVACKGQPDQSTIVRLVKTDEGFHIWHYAIKKSPLPAENEKVWTANLNAMETGDDSESEDE